MADVFQTVQASLTGAVALVKLLEWADRVRKADQIAKRALETAEEITQLLKEIRRTLRQRIPLPDNHPQKRNDVRILGNLDEKTQACKGHIQAGTDDLFGKGAVNLARRTVRRLKIASNPGRIARLTEDLRFDIQVLTTFLLLLQFHDNAVARSGSIALQDSTDGYDLRSISEMLQSQKLLRNLAEDAARKPMDAMASERASQNTSSEDSDSSRTDVPSQSDASTALSESTKDAIAVLQTFSNARFSASAATECDDARSLAAAENQSLSEVDESSQEQSYSVEVLKQMRQRYTEQAAEAQEEGDWPKARSALQNLIRTRKKAETLTGDAFENELVWEQMLVNVLLQLNHWDDALQRIETLEQQHPVADPPSRDAVCYGRLDRAHRDQLRALVYLDRYSKSASQEVHLANTDAVSARKSAHRAYNVHHEAVRQSPDKEALARYVISVRLLVTSLRILDLDDGVEAESVLATAKEICGHSFDLNMTSNDTFEEDSKHDVFEFEGEDHDGQVQTDTADLPPQRNRASQGSSSASSSGLATSQDIIEAVKKGLIDELRRYHQTHPDILIEGQDGDGWTAMHHAADAGNVELVELLLPHTNTDIRTKTDSGETALLIAVRHAEPEPGVIKALAVHKLFTDSRFFEDSNALHYAVDRDNTKATEALLSTDCGRELIDIPDIAGMTALHFCCSRERTAQVEQILEHCGNNAIDMRDLGREVTALDIALAKASADASQIVGMILRKHPQARYSESSKPALDRYLAKVRENSRTDSGIDNVSIGSSE